MTKLAIFIHAAILDRVSERLQQYVSLMQESGLLDVAQRVVVSFIGKDPIPEVPYTSVQPVHSSSDLQEFEVPTQQLLYEYAVSNPDAKILYLHTKGVGKEVNMCIEEWVAYMIHFLVKEWKHAVESLESCVSCGVDLSAEPTLHYSGNFWWARADYIASLPPPSEFKNIERYPNPLHSERHNQEFWVCWNKSKPHCSLWNSNINVYHRHISRYPSDQYLNKTAEYKIYMEEPLSISALFKLYGNRNTLLGTDKVITHMYGDVYDSLFYPRKDTTLSLLEIGFSGGHSLLCYAKYFKNAKITGIDIENNVRADIFNHPQITTFFANAHRSDLQKSLGEFDIIIEDASHQLEDQIAHFHEYRRNVKAGGLYIIEDINKVCLQDLLTHLLPIAKSDGFSPLVFNLTKLSDRGDDILLVFQKDI